MSDELIDLARALDVSGEKAQAASYKATVVEAHKMRDEWRKEVGGGTFSQAAAAISYDILPTGLRSITAEVGFDDRGQGELGNIIEFGSSRQGPIHPAGQKVVDGGASRLEKYLGTLDPL